MSPEKLHNRHIFGENTRLRSSTLKFREQKPMDVLLMYVDLNKLFEVLGFSSVTLVISSGAVQR